MLLNYEKYTLQELGNGVAWCDRCQANTESSALVANNHALPSFVICWNCHDVRQSGVGSLRDAQLRNEAVRAVAQEEERCHADRDGDCDWVLCPQNRDGEPGKTGRHCPLDVMSEREW